MKTENILEFIYVELLIKNKSYTDKDYNKFKKFLEEKTWCKIMAGKNCSHYLKNIISKKSVHEEVNEIKTKMPNNIEITAKFITSSQFSNNIGFAKSNNKILNLRSNLNKALDGTDWNVTVL